MTFSYDLTLATDDDQVRFLIGDTVEASSKVSDEEIAAVLVLQPLVGFAAVICAEAKMAKYAEEVNTKNSRLSVDAAERFKHYEKLVAKLKQKAANPFSGSNAVPSGARVGGRLISERVTMDAETDAIQPTFKRKANNNPGYDNNDETDRC